MGSAIVAACLLLLLASCGGDAGDATPSPAPVDTSSTNDSDAEPLATAGETPDAAASVQSEQQSDQVVSVTLPPELLQALRTQSANATFRMIYTSSDAQGSQTVVLAQDPPRSSVTVGTELRIVDDGVAVISVCTSQECIELPSGDPVISQTGPVADAFGFATNLLIDEEGIVVYAGFDVTTTEEFDPATGRPVVCIRHDNRDDSREYELIRQCLDRELGVITYSDTQHRTQGASTLVLTDFTQPAAADFEAGPPP